METTQELIDRLIDLAFAEDIGDGDHTTLSCIPDEAMGKSKLLIKDVVTERTTDAECYAAYERYSYYDP